MGRTKLQLKFIQDQSKRSATYRKRKQGLKKKARELAILCDVPVLVISFAPRGEVDVLWPEDEGAIGHIIENYSQIGADIRSKQQLDVPGYMKAQISKHQASFNRRLRDLAETPSLPPDDTVDATQGTLRELLCKLDSKLEVITGRIQVLKQQSSVGGETMWAECNVEGQQQAGELVPHNGMVATQPDHMVSDPYLTMSTSLQYPILPMDHFNSGEIYSNAYLNCPNYVPMGMGGESSAMVPSIPTFYVPPLESSDVLPVPPLWSPIGLPGSHNFRVGGAAEQNHSNIEVAQNNVDHSDIGLAQDWMVNPMPTYVSSKPWPSASNPPINHGHLLQSNGTSDGLGSCGVPAIL